MTVVSNYYPLSQAQLRLLLAVHRGQLVSVRGPRGRFVTEGFAGPAERGAWRGLRNRLGLLRVDADQPADGPRRWFLTVYGRRELAAAGLLGPRPGQVGEPLSGPVLTTGRAS